MLTSYVTGWKKSFDYSGRATRSDYWWFVLLDSIILIILFVLKGLGIYLLMNAPDNPLGSIFDIVGTLWIIYGVAQIFPSLSLSVRRMNDIGKGWVWLLINLVPCIGGFWFLYLLIQPSVVG